MTVQERLEFIRAGYTRAEIEEFEIAAEAKPAPAEAPEETPAPAEAPEEATPAGEAHAPASAPDWANALQASIDKLVKVTQARNAMFDDMGDAQDTATNAEQALAKYLTGK